MSKNDKNIDAYSKALLDKKTEYNDELKSLKRFIRCLKQKEDRLKRQCLQL